MKTERIYTQVDIDELEASRKQWREKAVAQNTLLARWYETIPVNQFDGHYNELIALRKDTRNQLD